MSDANGSVCTAGPRDFTATAYQNDGERWVRVKGTCSCPTPGFKLTFELASPPIVPTPDELPVDLLEKEPTGTVTQVVTQTEVEGKFAIGDKVERILIRNRGITVTITDGY